MSAQYGEEEVIARCFPTWGSNPGFFVDVGAADGVTHSNTEFLYRAGWSGIYVEPSISQYANLIKNVPPREGIQHINKAAFSAEGTLDFYCEEGQASTLSTEFRDRVIDRHGVKYQIVKVPCLLLTTILKDSNCPHVIDFLSIDAEGVDMEVLKSLDWNTYRPRLVCVEHSMPIDILDAFMAARDYSRYAQTEGNTFFSDVLS